VWKIRVPEKCKPHWDTVTLVMRNVLKKKAGFKGNVLEIGIGEAALNSLYFFKLTGNAVDGIDVSETRVVSSSRIAEFNRLKVKFWRSDLFNAVTDTYKLIFFNPPYVPTQTGKALNLSEAMTLDGNQVWDGGEDGMQVIKQFMVKAGDYLASDGIILLGVQDHYVSKENITRVATENNFLLKYIHASSMVNVLIPTSVYELSKKLNTHS
jgi:release factor glutamine methyltransferase